MDKTIWPVRVDIDGMAVTGRSLNALRGLRFADDDETGENTPAPDPVENTPDPVEDAQADILASAQSRIAELEMQLADANAKLLKVQAHNYSLLMGTPPEGDTASTPANSQNSDDPDEVIDPVDVFFDDDK